MADRLEGNIHIVSRADALDAEQLLELQHSTAWDIYRRRLVAMLESYRTQCEQESDPIKLHQAQGAATALRAVLQVPDTMVSEVRSRLARAIR